MISYRLYVVSATHQKHHTQPNPTRRAVSTSPPVYNWLPGASPAASTHATMPRIPPTIILLVSAVAVAASSSGPTGGGSGQQPLSFDLELYTSDALSIEGGAFVSMSECSFLAEQGEGDDDDGNSDGEDDDDDGHSSMLSNASLSRKRVASGASSPTSFAPNVARSSHGHSSSDARQQPRVAGPAFSLKERKNRRRNANQNKSAALDAAISIRGGAASAAAKDPAELTRRLLVAALVTILYEFVLGHLLEFVKIGEDV